MGTYLQYKLVQGIFIIVPIIFFILFLSPPETPVYLMKNGKPKEAEESLKYLRGIDSNETEQLPENFKLELEKLSEVKITEDDNNAIKFSDFKSRATIKGIVIGIGLVAINQFSGSFALINFTSQIFEEARTGLDSNLSAIVVGIMQIAGSYGSYYFVDRSGRKKLYLISAMGTGLGLTVMGTFSFLKSINIDVSTFRFVPVISLSFVIFIASCGILPLTYIIISEINTQKLRSFATSLCMTLNWSFAFFIIMVKQII